MPAVGGEVQRGGVDALLMHGDHRAKAGGKISKREAEQGAVLWLWEDLEGCFRYDAERAFSADK
jgi:hypothetical protein